MPTIHNGDCIETMKAMPPESVDAIITDPPYGLSFMQAKWDATPPGVQWAEACYRVLKPGGHIAAFGGTRTWHRLAVAIEDAGFEMRDSLAWLYGSGFPKSHDVSKAIDKLDAADERLARAREFQGWLRQHLTPRQVNEATGTDMGRHLTTHPTQPAVATADLFDMLRPHLPDVPERIEELVRLRTVESQNYAARPITQAEVRPLEVGEVISFDQRASTHRERRDIPATPEAAQWDGWGTALKPAFEPIVLARKPFPGTVAANVLEHGTGAINVDACRIGTDEDTSRTPAVVQSTSAPFGAGVAMGGRGHASGRWPANVLLDQHTAAWVDEQSGVLRSGARKAGQPRNASGKSSYVLPELTTWEGGASSGGASRFFYTAKAPKTERPNVDGVQHPTVKPLAIMRWLIRLVTPPGGVVLDPFAGSGTTIEAALIEGFNPVGIEMEADYLPLIQHRIDRQAGTLTA